MTRRPFSDEALVEARTIRLADDFQRGRTEVQGIMIDGPTTKDRDDAIWISPNNEGWTVDVSISDIASLIPIGTSLDREIAQRAFSTYTAWSSDHMMPRFLAEDVLSLTSNRVCPTITVSIKLDKGLNVVGAELKKSFLSHPLAITYGQAANEMELPHSALHEWGILAQGLLENRRRSGALAIYDTKTGMYVTGDGEIQFLRAESASSYILVQEAMILANRVVADLMLRADIPYIYRNHTAHSDDPNKEFLTFEDIVSGPDFRGTRTSLNHLYKKAMLGADNIGHLALRMGAYGWFTSPIRRYCDLLNHRQVAHYIDGIEPPYSHAHLDSAAQSINLELAHLDSRRSDSFRNIARREVDYAIATASPQELEALDVSRFSKLVEDSLGYNLTDERRDIVLGAIAKRIEGGQLDSKDLAAIVIEGSPDDEAWSQLKDMIVERIKRKPQEAVAMLNHARQSHAGWNYRIDAEALGGYFSGSVIVTIGDSEYSPSTRAPGSRKDLAGQQAAVLFWEQFIEGILVSPEETRKITEREAARIIDTRNQATDNTFNDNPLSRLTQLSQRFGWNVVFDIKTLPGSRFCCHLTVSGNNLGEPVQIVGPTSSSKQSARTSAALRFLTDKSVATALSASPVPTTPNTEKNPVSVLMELAQRRGWAVSESYSMAGPSHMPVVTATITITGNGLSDPIVARAEKSSKKDAKAAAAQILVGRFVQAVATSPVTVRLAQRKLDITFDGEKNPISAMMELAQARSWKIDEISGSSGPSHIPRFSVTITATGGDLKEPVVVRSSESGRKQLARSEAARALVTVITLDIIREQLPEGSSLYTALGRVRESLCNGNPTGLSVAVQRANNALNGEGIEQDIKDITARILSFVNPEQTAQRRTLER